MSATTSLEGYRKALRERLTASEEDIENALSILDRYSLELSVNNFDRQGLLLRDSQGRTVRILSGENRDGSVHLPHTKSDIVIIFLEGMCLGWVELSRMEDLKDRYILDIKSSSPMPEEFTFKQECSHMSIHGGWTDGVSWYCLGCEQKLGVFGG